MTEPVGPGEGEGAGGKEAEELAAAHRGVRVAGIAAAASVAVLSVVTSWSLPEVLGLPVFLVLLPGLALAQLPLLRTAEWERIPVYLGSAVTILFLGGSAAVLLVVGGVAPFPFAGLPADRMLLWTSGLTLAGLTVMGPSSWLELRMAPERGAVLRALLPRTGKERLAFVGLSLSAGVGEEIAYRGYALATLLVLGVNPWIAVILSSAAFGVLHAYQGSVGIARTAVVGAILALPVLYVGSLYPAIAAHVLLDLIGGLVVGPRLPLVPVPAEE